MRNSIDVGSTGSFCLPLPKSNEEEDEVGGDDEADDADLHCSLIYATTLSLQSPKLPVPFQG